MTPYRWHGPPDIDRRPDDAAAGGGFVATAEVQLTCYHLLPPAPDRRPPGAPAGGAPTQPATTRRRATARRR